VTTPRSGSPALGIPSSPYRKTATPPVHSILNLPVLIDFHGGSFILGTPQEQAPFCSRIAREIGSKYPGGGCVVLSVDYRLGPYAQYPAANEDAEDVVRAILEESSPAGLLLRERIREEIASLGRHEVVNLDKSRIALSGFSSGGNIALTLVMSVKDDPTIGRDWPSVFPPDYPREIPILLFYPSLDSRLLPDERPRPPGLDPPAGFFTRLKIESELMPKYLPVEQRSHPRASPGLGVIADGGLHAQAKMMLILPELDSLFEQSMDWIQKMEEEGRIDDLTVVPVPGVYHGWTQFPDTFLKNDDERQKKDEVFTVAREFVESIWSS
jgi:acetyl esterase/lipase